MLVMLSMSSNVIFSEMQRSSLVCVRNEQVIKESIHKWTEG